MEFDLWRYVHLIQFLSKHAFQRVQHNYQKSYGALNHMLSTQLFSINIYAVRLKLTVYDFSLKITEHPYKPPSRSLLPVFAVSCQWALAAIISAKSWERKTEPSHMETVSWRCFIHKQTGVLTHIVDSKTHSFAALAHIHTHTSCGLCWRVLICFPVQL